MDMLPPPPDDTDMETEWLSVFECADRLGLHPQTVYRQLRDGRFPFHAVRVGRKWRIHAADFEASWELNST